MKNIKSNFLILSSFLMFLSCRKDPCTGIVCKNGGNCINGICNCPASYTGSDCGTEKTPSSVTISKIVLTNYPMTDGSGAGWDITAGPDIFLSFNSGSSANTSNFNSGVVYDVTGGTLTYTNNFPMTISTPTSTWSVGLWDYDSPDPDDYMGGVSFIPNNYKSGFPSTINLSVSPVNMTLYVTWNF